MRNISNPFFFLNFIKKKSHLDFISRTRWNIQVLSEKLYSHLILPLFLNLRHVLFYSCLILPHFPNELWTIISSPNFSSCLFWSRIFLLVFRKGKKKKNINQTQSQTRHTIHTLFILSKPIYMRHACSPSHQSILTWSPRLQQTRKQGLTIKLRNSYEHLVMSGEQTKPKIKSNRSKSGFFCSVFFCLRLYFAFQFRFINWLKPKTEFIIFDFTYLIFYQ